MRYLRLLFEAIKLIFDLGNLGSKRMIEWPRVNHKSSHAPFVTFILLDNLRAEHLSHFFKSPFNKKQRPQTIDGIIALPSLLNLGIQQRQSVFDKNQDFLF